MGGNLPTGEVEVKIEQFEVDSPADVLPMQVAGEVEWVSPSLVAGGFFGEGDPLVRIETSDYAAALESARAAVSRASSQNGRRPVWMAANRKSRNGPSVAP